MNHKFLVHKRGDDVGVAVADIEQDEHVRGIFMDDDSVVDLASLDNVPLGHKIAIRTVASGAKVLEYGIPIGKATQPLEPGTYVHTHNLKSARW